MNLRNILNYYEIFKSIFLFVAIGILLTGCSKAEINEKTTDDHLISQSSHSDSIASSGESQQIIVSVSLPNEELQIDYLMVGTAYELIITQVPRASLLYNYVSIKSSSEFVTIRPKVNYPHDEALPEIKFILTVNSLIDYLSFEVDYKGSTINMCYPVTENKLDSTLISYGKSGWNAEGEMLVAQNKDDYFSLCSDNGVACAKVSDDLFVNNDIVLIHQFANLDLNSIELESVFTFDSTIYFQIIAEYETGLLIGDSSVEYVFYVAVPKLSYKTLKKNYVKLIAVGY